MLRISLTRKYFLTFVQDSRRGPRVSDAYACPVATEGILG